LFFERSFQVILLLDHWRNWSNWSWFSFLTSKTNFIGSCHTNFGLLFHFHVKYWPIYFRAWFAVKFYIELKKILYGVQLGMRSNQFKQSISWKIEKSWTSWKFWKKKSLIFSLWAHQMKIIEDHIVFIQIFCCSKLKNCSLSSLSQSNFQIFKPFKQLDCLNGLKLVWSHP
jgi:hypothetical protein